MIENLISVVDDDESVRDATQLLLRSAGYKVATFESGELFLKSDTLPDTHCLILDMCLPGMDGLELQRQVSILQTGVPIIFVTAHDDERSRQLAIDGGASEFFQKPFAANEFLAAILAVLKGGTQAAKQENLSHKGAEHPGVPAASQAGVVLIAEDEELVRTLAVRTLERAGYLVLPACNAEAAIELFRNSGVNVCALLTDVQMGSGISGIALAEQVLKQKPEIAVLIMSGFPDAEPLARKRNLGFLAKPFTPAKLLEQMRLVLASNPSAHCEGK